MVEALMNVGGLSLLRASEISSLLDFNLRKYTEHHSTQEGEKEEKEA